MQGTQASAAVTSPVECRRWAIETERTQWLREAVLLTELLGDIVELLRCILSRRCFLFLHPGEVGDVARPAGRQGLVAGGWATGVRRA